MAIIGYGVHVGPALGRSLKGPAKSEAPPSKGAEAEASEAEAPEAEDAEPSTPEAAPAEEQADRDVAPPVPSGESPLKGRDLIPISEIGDNPIRLETRTRKEDDGAGGVLEREVRFPIWFDAEALNGTPMCQALTQAQGVIHRFLSDHPACFPPIVVNITDGEATDGDPRNVAKVIREMKSDDGNVLLFNLHISSQMGAPVLFPDSTEGLTDEYAKLLFEMSSPLPEYMRSFALQDGYSVAPGARGFVFNGDIVSLISFLDIGTRPSNLR